MDNYPAGAEHDPRAPYNEVEENSCLYCGELTEKSFCDKNCRNAYRDD